MHDVVSGASDEYIWKYILGITGTITTLLLLQYKNIPLVLEMSNKLALNNGPVDDINRYPDDVNLYFLFAA